MNRFDQQWQKLTALARQAADDRDSAIPAGFATRVVALAAAAPVSGPWFTLERLALRGLLAASVCCAAAVAYNLVSASADQTDIYATGTTDSIVELLDIS